MVFIVEGIRLFDFIEIIKNLQQSKYYSRFLRIDEERLGCLVGRVVQEGVLWKLSKKIWWMREGDRINSLQECGDFID